MTFLAPWAGIAAAAIALPALALLYMLKLRRRPLRVSSTLLWEQSVRDLEVNAPWRWLRASLMLLLHALLVLLLVGAIARPAVRGADVGAERVIILIDRSASMSALDGRPESDAQPGAVSRLDEAKRRAMEITDDLRRGNAAKVMIAAFAHDAGAVSAFTSDRAAIREAVGAVTPTDQPGDGAAAWRLVRAHSAAEEAEREEPEGPERERLTVYVISDGPVSDAGAGGGPGPRVDVRTVRVGGWRNAERAEDGGAIGGNAGIVAMGAQRDYEDPAVARVFVRVRSSGTGAEGSALLECRVNGRVAATRRVLLNRSAPEPVGEAALTGSTTFELNQRDAAVVTVSLVGRDLLGADDAASVVLDGAARPRVLVVSGRAPPPFLLTALESADLGTLRIVNAPVYESIVQEQSRQAGAPSPYDLVIFDGVEPSRAPPVPSISLGAGMPGSGIRAEPIEDTGPEGTIRASRFASWMRTHPVMRSVTLDGIVARPPMRMRVDPAAESGVEELALGTGGVGPLIIAAVDRGDDAPGVRRLFVGFDLMRSNWGPDYGFPVFLFNAVDFLTLRGEAAAGRMFTTSEAAVVPLPTGTPAGGVVRLSGPVELSATVRTGLGVAPSVNFGVIERAGVYTLDGAGAAGDGAVAVNLLDEAETLQGGAADARGPSAEPREVERGGAAGGGASSSAGDGVREIWRWLIGAALILLVIEWVVYSRVARADGAGGTLGRGAGGGRRGGTR